GNQAWRAHVPRRTVQPRVARWHAGWHLAERLSIAPRSNPKANSHSPNHGPRFDRLPNRGGYRRPWRDALTRETPRLRCLIRQSKRLLYVGCDARSALKHGRDP